MSRLLFHECLGRGGYGEVYRCTWHRREMELEVAVKVLNASVAKGSEAQKRLKDEARLLGALTHPGILRVYDLIELRGNVAMIAEYVEGADLDRCVLEGLPARALVEAVGRVSSALAAAWGDISPVSGKPLRLVHRDVKPENIRITPHGEVKILDFGVARAAELRRESETASNTVLGSYRYMAPERFDSGLVPHPSVDIFALGCILYEGLAFRRLFEHLSMREMLVLSLPGTERFEKFIEERIRELPKETAPSTVQLIRRLVSRDPAHRPMPGRLAALCDDEADHIDGPGLAQWCRSREWPRVFEGDGEWSGQEHTVTDANSGEYDTGAIYGELPEVDGETGDSTLSHVDFEPRELDGEEPGFAPRGLGFGDADGMPEEDPDTEPDIGAPVFEDEPTQGKLRPPPPPEPPVRSSTRDPAPPRTDGPPVPRPAPPIASEGPIVEADHTLQQPRSVLDEAEAILLKQRRERAEAETAQLPPPAESLGPYDAPAAPETIELDPDSEIGSGAEAGGEPALPTMPPADEVTVPRNAPVPSLDPEDAPRPPSDLDTGPISIHEDPTLPTPPPDPDRTATEAVNLDRLREQIDREKKRIEARRANQKLEEETSTADVPPVKPVRQDSIPDDLFDVPLPSEERRKPGLEEPPEDDDATPVQEPRKQTPEPTPISAAARRRKKPAVSGAVVANVVALGVLLALGVIGIVGWILFF